MLYTILSILVYIRASGTSKIQLGTCAISSLTILTILKQINSILSHIGAYWV